MIPGYIDDGTDPDEIEYPCSQCGQPLEAHRQQHITDEHGNDAEVYTCPQRYRLVMTNTIDCWAYDDAEADAFAADLYHEWAHIWNTDERSIVAADDDTFNPAN